MPTFAIIVQGTASIEETWLVERKRKPTVKQAIELLQKQSAGIKFVNETVTGDEERDYSTVVVEVY